MTSFEFVFGLISVVTSLALTQLPSGCVALLPSRRKRPLVLAPRVMDGHGIHAADRQLGLVLEV
jgi:hypothetical protein